MKAVCPAAMHEWMMGMQAGSLGPKMGAERRAQVEKVGVLALRTMFSARVWWTCEVGGK